MIHIVESTINVKMLFNNIFKNYPQYNIATFPIFFYDKCFKCHSKKTDKITTVRSLECHLTGRNG